MAQAQLRGNTAIDYTQLGLRFRLQAWEVSGSAAPVCLGQLGSWACGGACGHVGRACGHMGGTRGCVGRTHGHLGRARGQDLLSMGRPVDVVRPVVPAGQCNLRVPREGPSGQYRVGGARLLPGTAKLGATPSWTRAQLWPGSPRKFREPGLVPTWGTWTKTPNPHLAGKPLPWGGCWESLDPY